MGYFELTAQVGLIGQRSLNGMSQVAQSRVQDALKVHSVLGVLQRLGIFLGVLQRSGIFLGVLQRLEAPLNRRLSCVRFAPRFTPHFIPRFSYRFALLPALQAADPRGAEQTHGLLVRAHVQLLL